MLRIAIDGACRRNGKADCVSASGVFYTVTTMDGVSCGTRSTHECNSTNQRGEQLALVLALELALEFKRSETHIITDSEYLFNAMTKNWCDRWEHNGWKTAAGDDVKNADLWKRIKDLADACEAACVPVAFYHIKGHCISFGPVTAERLLESDSTGRALLAEMCKKFDASLQSRAKVFEAAQNLSERNNGFPLPDHIFREFVVMNAMADIVATRIADAADIGREG